jgi:4-amino-4-deoxy-L-arabinose transferase-like glycosyltransferase
MLRVLAVENPRPGSRWIAAFLLTLAALALYLPGLGDGDFVGDDEALDAGVATEMVRTGDWLFPEFNGEYLPPKPPLFYWAAALAARSHGRADGSSSRLPSALAGAAMVGLTAAAATPIVGLGPATLGAAMLATMPMVFGEARVARCDMLLAFLASGCLFILASARTGPIAPAERWLFWSLLGLAAMTKGGAGVGLVVIVALVSAALERDLTALRSLCDRSVAAFLLIGSSWYVVASLHWGYRFVDEQILGENFRHLIGLGGISDKGAGVRPLAERLTYYLKRLLPAALPWSMLLPTALFASWRTSPELKNSRFFVVWLVAGLAFFTAPLRKSPYYLLPLMPPVALLCASWIFPRVRDSVANGWPRPDVPSFRLSLGGAAVTIAAAIYFAARASSCELDAVSRALLQHPAVTSLGILLLGGGFFGTSVAAVRRHWAAGVGAVLVGLYGSLWIAGVVGGATDSCVTLRPLAEAIRARVDGGDWVRFFLEPLPAVVLYAERRIPTLRDPGARPSGTFYLVVPDSRGADMPKDWRDSARSVFEVYGRAFTRKPMTVRLLRLPPVTEPAR